MLVGGSGRMMHVHTILSQTPTHNCEQKWLQQLFPGTAKRVCPAKTVKHSRRTLPGVSCEGQERSTHALKRIRSPTLTGRRKVMPSTSTAYRREWEKGAGRVTLS